MADTSLNQAIADAHAELSAKAGKGNEPATDTATDTADSSTDSTDNADSETDSVESDDEAQETDASETDELSEQELLESKNLYKALRDPKQAAMVVAAMAQQMGLLPGQQNAPTTKAEAAAAKKEIKDIVAEALGPEYKFLADRMAMAFDQVVETVREETRAELQTVQQSEVERQVVDAYAEVARETKGESKKLESRMAQLSEEVPIGTMDVKTYMRRLYQIAAAEKRPAPQKVAEQIRRNANDAGARLRGGSVPKVEGSELPDKKMSLNESIAWAQAQLQKRNK